MTSSRTSAGYKKPPVEPLAAVQNDFAALRIFIGCLDILPNQPFYISLHTWLLFKVRYDIRVSIDIEL